MEVPNRTTVIIGPSGAGKSTQVKELLSTTPDAELIRTLTDRPRRGPNDDDTHIFTTSEELEHMEQRGQLLRRVPAMGHNYGLQPFSNYGTKKILLLRALFVPDVVRALPDTAVIQFEAPVEVLMERLKKRGDADRADPELLQKEMLLGQTVAHYTISTNRPRDEVSSEFHAIWHEIHNS